MARRGRPKGGGMSPDEAREHLLDAAEACFGRFGIEKTTVDDVAAEAELSRGMVYRHFSGRDELVTGVVARMTDRYISRITQELDGSESLGELIVTTLTDVVTAVRADPSVAPFFADSGRDFARAATSDAGVIRDRARTFARQVLEQAGDDQLAELRPGLDVDAAVDHIVTVGLALIQGYGPLADDDPDALRRYLSAFLLPALVTDPPPLD